MKTPSFLLFSLLIPFFSWGASEVRSLPLQYDEPKKPEPWHGWRYDAIARDYVGNCAPAGYACIDGVGWRSGGCSGTRDSLPVRIVIEKGDSSGVFEKTLELEKLSAFINSISSLAGAYVEDGAIYVIGKRKRKELPWFLTPEDFVVASRAVFQDPTGGVFSSIDPPPDHSARRKHSVVRYGGGIARTHIGQVLFESDRILKSISLGYDNIRKDSLRFAGNWHRAKLDFRDFPKTKKEMEIQHQIWLSSEGMVVGSDSMIKTMKFVEEGFHAQARRCGRDDESSHKPVDRATERFVANLNQCLPKYIEHFRVFQELRGISQLVGVLLWLRNQGISIFFDDELSQSFYCRYTPAKTSVLTVKREKTTEKRVRDALIIDTFMIGVVGGIDLRNHRFEEKELKEFKKKALKNEDYVVFQLF